ncbi:MAG: helix-turn-helix domain-containing protein [Gemmatimonadaceae bacterium]
MYYITTANRLIQQIRERAHFTQRELAERAGMSQPAIAKLEQGAANPTLETLARCAAAAGFDLRLELVPQAPADPVVLRYQEDLDRSLLRENLRTPVDQRLRSLGEWQEAGRALQRATHKAAKARKKT